MIFAIGIGSNLGNRHENIVNSMNLMKKSGIKILKTSLLYQSRAFVRQEDEGNKEFDVDFLNMAILCESNDMKNPREILKTLKKIEEQIGRVENGKWTPRLIDLDLLFFDNLVVNDYDLKIPHRELEKRAFVIIPLLQIMPEWSYPDKKNNLYGKSIAQIYQKNFFSTRENFINTTPYNLRITGIVNLTPDSCSGDGYLKDKTIDINKICEEIWNKFKNGASVLDFGAQSTRPGFEIIEPEIEIERLKTIMDVFFQNYYSRNKIYPTISIDSFYSKVIEYCVKNYAIDIINDVSGLQNLDLLNFVENSDRKIVLTHNLKLNSYDSKTNNLNEMIEWFERKIETILTYRSKTIKPEQIILDPGIGFGKTVHEQWVIVKNIETLKKQLNFPILFGHSKKSFLKTIAGDYTERTSQTLGVSSIVAKHVDYLRVHDVELHAKTLSAIYF